MSNALFCQKTYFHQREICVFILKKWMGVPLNFHLWIFQTFCYFFMIVQVHRSFFHMTTASPNLKHINSGGGEL